jgi:hypothetical protein
MVTQNKKSSKTKELTLVAIYKFKCNKKFNGTRCYLLRNADGKEYQVWTHENGCASHCDCDGFTKSHGKRRCYHIKSVEAREAAAMLLRDFPAMKTTDSANMPQVENGVRNVNMPQVENGVRNVNMDWLLGGCGRRGTFAGRGTAVSLWSRKEVSVSNAVTGGQVDQAS